MSDFDYDLHRSALNELVEQAIERLEDGLNSNKSAEAVQAAKEVLDRVGLTRAAKPADPVPLIPPEFLVHALPGLLRLTGADASTTDAAQQHLETSLKTYIHQRASGGDINTKIAESKLANPDAPARLDDPATPASDVTIDVEDAPARSRFFSSFQGDHL